jgi:tetratricopeptide (TPR) repeat protein/tRNA A-37 threonylcarbamoyl transferase component Bud32
LDEEDSTKSIPWLPAPWRRGDRLAGRFVVVQFLAKGGMGEVYEVADEHLQGRHFALKTLRPEIAADPLLRHRFETEVLLAREVRHPNVCPTYDLIRDDRPGGTLLYLTMKLLRGESLLARLRRSGRLDPEVTLTIARQMAAALDAAHQCGVIHRDFKPGNVMLETAGADVRVSITDFGLSRLYQSDDTLSEPGKLFGTVGYIAPELLEGRIAAPAVDVYAFGVVVHEMLTGQRPRGIPGKSGVKRPSSLVEGVPEVWDQIVLGCLESDPARRFQSAGEALAALDKPAYQSHRPPARKPVSRRAMINAGAAAAVACSGAAWLGWPKIDRLLHPLPEERFVAVMAWPPKLDETTGPLLRTMLDSIANRLVRAELVLKKFTVIMPSAVSQTPQDLADIVTSLGANLLLGASLSGERGEYQLWLRLFDATRGTVLRKREAHFGSVEIGLLAERASLMAADLLEVPLERAAVKEDETSKLPPAAFRLFSEAGDLASQPNDKGLDGAIEKFQKVLEEEPRFALAYADLALAYSRKYLIVKDSAFLGLAEKNATLALQYNPRSAKGQMALAKFDLLSGNTQKALDGFRRALQLDPGNPEVLLYKAKAFSDLARMKDAEEVFREIIRQRPNYWPAYNDLGWNLYRQTRYAEAADAFGEGAAVAPRVALPLANQGTMYAILGDAQKAEDSFSRSLQRSPNEFAYTNLGTLAFQKGDYLKAASDYKKALYLNPKNAQMWRNLADCYEILGDSKGQMESYLQAAKILAEAVRVNPKPGSDWATLAFYHAKLGRRAEAESDLKTADERGLDPHARFTKAQALAVLGRKDEALDLILRCLDEGVTPRQVDLALDLKEVRADPKYRQRVAVKSGRH